MLRPPPPPVQKVEAKAPSPPPSAGKVAGVGGAISAGGRNQGGEDSAARAEYLASITARAAARRVASGGPSPQHKQPSPGFLPKRPSDSSWQPSGGGGTREGVASLSRASSHDDMLELQRKRARLS